LKFRDGNGKSVSLAGSPEIKGIRGTDHRKYIIDLLRLSPRDLNYSGTQYEACVLRHELVAYYADNICLQHAEKLM
jgi:protein TIF31